MNTLELKNLIMQCSQIGAAAYQRLLEPTADLISQRDVKKWLKRLGQQPEILKKLEDSGLVRAQRTGEAINSKIVYSKMELLSAISAINIQEKIITNK